MWNLTAQTRDKWLPLPPKEKNFDIMMVSIKGRLSILLFAMLCVLYSCSEKAVVEKYDSGKAKLVAEIK